ncbi:MAG: NAD(P)-dependent alcohol dehydrogenase [Anaerolineales bacterium]|nr:NAD(P)-dependent alcohol dehydrogenase [Anaerolineales bacterium]MCB9434367.1 NAD(P)-dependent alcohol dehydrogenase [Ardenticatenaceae bacterium]
MKAVVFPKYGSPDVLQFVEVEKPTVGDKDVLVKVVAASVNPLDWRRMRGAPFLVRLSEGLMVPKNGRLGADIAGTVEAVGKDVTEFQPGDAVFSDIGAGGFAEYVAVPEKLLVHKPENVSFADAAAVPVAGLTALQGLRDKANLQAGQHVVVNGASGGVGTYAVQIAKAWGAEVTAVCSTRNLEMVRAIGADHVIDYTQEDFTKNGRCYDLIYDAVGNKSVAAYNLALNPNGKAIVAGFTTMPRMLQVMTLGALSSKITGKEIAPLMAHIVKDDLAFLADMLAAGRIRSVIDRCYPLAEVAEAMRYVETKRAQGKVIIDLQAR